MGEEKLRLCEADLVYSSAGVKRPGQQGCLYTHRHVVQPLKITEKMVWPFFSPPDALILSPEVGICLPGLIF